MDYQRIYSSIIANAKQKEDDRKVSRRHGEYYENHHIIPKSLGGSDSLENLVLLTAREHFIVHFLLAKHYNKYGSIAQKEKMISAFTQMCRNRHGKRISSRSYQYARKMWSEYLKENHWAYDDLWKKKHSKIMKEYYEKNPQNKIECETEIVSCSCGCKESFVRKLGSAQQYIHGHNSRVMSKSTRKKQSDSMKKNLSVMTYKELSERSKRSFGNCDHLERGKKISSSKKGKPSNQKEIVGKKLALMDDFEFEAFLNEKNYSKTIRTRFSKYRDEYV